jgi:hypothetical protein
MAYRPYYESTMQIMASTIKTPASGNVIRCKRRYVFVVIIFLSDVVLLEPSRIGEIAVQISIDTSGP